MVVLLFLLMSAGVWACSLTKIPPHISFVSKDEAVCHSMISTFDSQGFKPPSSVAIPCTIQISSVSSERPSANERIDSIALSAPDSETILNFLTKYQDQYVSIEKQSDSEFNEFEQMRKTVNANICNCSRIDLIERSDGWTAYTMDVKDTCSFGASCWTPPAPCPGADYVGLRAKLTFWDIVKLPWAFLKFIKFTIFNL